MTGFNIYKILLLLLHAIYSGFEYLFDIWIYIKINYIENNRDSKLQDRYVLKIRHFEKIPTHLTVLLGTEKPSFRDLANLVLWSLGAGITFISFYDHEGYVKKHEEDFQNELDELRQADDQIIWNAKKNSDTYEVSKKCIQVKTFSILDGRQRIVDTTKELAGKVPSRDISVDFVDSHLKKYYEFPDPHLGLYSGKQFNVYGYPPWQIRFTEFINVRTFHNITQQCFFNILQVYSKVEHKLGK